MMQILFDLLKKYWDIFLYLFFGFLTTLVSYGVYLTAYNVFGISAALSNCISWALATVFAYLTNKPFVFRSHDWSMRTVGPEFTKFVSCRLTSGVIETVILLVVVDWLSWNGNLWKIITSVFVVLFNYFGSKLLVFRKK